MNRPKAPDILAGHDFVSIERRRAFQASFGDLLRDGWKL
jgi:hypothetical protein